MSEGAGVRRAPWTLTQQELDTFLERLGPDRDEAGHVYELVRRKLLTFFRCNGHWDAEDLVDETIDRVVRRLGEIEVRDLIPFIRGVARHVASETHKTSTREIPLEAIAEPFQMPKFDAGEELANERRLKCLEKCGGNLIQQDKELIFAYYRFDKGEKIENKRRIAQELGVTLGALRVRAFRARQQLERCIARCEQQG